MNIPAAFAAAVEKTLAVHGVGPHLKILEVGDPKGRLVVSVECNQGSS